MLAAGIIEAVKEILSWYKDFSKVPIVPKLKLVAMPKKKDVSQLKIRPLEKIIFGSVNTLTALTSCNDEILRNLAPFGQDLPSFGHIWCLQCTVMEYLVIGFYKKTPRPVEIRITHFLEFYSSVHVI